MINTLEGEPRFKMRPRLCFRIFRCPLCLQQAKNETLLCTSGSENVVYCTLPFPVF
jgi:hypothetical protein